MKLISSVILLLLCWVAVVYSNSGDVLVNNLKMYVDEKEFFIKAICYNPVPLGIQLETADGGGGGGLCSPKLTPYNEWKSACYDSDFFDGSSDVPDREPQGPPSWFEPLWQRDFPLIKALGANTIRIYNSNPTTREASLIPSNGIPLPLGKDHIPFMDMAASSGLKVIYPLYADNTALTTVDAATMQQFIRWQIDEVGNHTALLMFTFGNELDLYGTPSLVPIVNSYISYAKGYLLQKWNRVVPFTSAVVDLPQSYNTLLANLNVDVFTTNAGYRAFDFSDLWSGNSQTDGMYALSCRYNKPIFIGEIGWLSINNEVNTQYPDWVNRVWKDLVGHIEQGCIGGAYFEYSDEKYTKADPLQQDLGLVTLSVNQNSDQPNIFLPDIATPKAVIYQALASGTYQGISYNMNADVFSLIGRSPTTLASSHSICGGATSAPTSRPTSSPTAAPTSVPTSAPTSRPTSTPTSAPTAVPTSAPTSRPTSVPTSAPTSAPTSSPTAAPTSTPSSPTSAPTAAPTSTPSSPTSAPTAAPTSTPSSPTSAPTAAPTSTPSSPTSAPTSAPTTCQHNNCASGLSCCADARMGQVCYNPTTHTCARGNLGNVLCGAHDSACGYACYDATRYVCCSGALFGAQEANIPCAHAQADDDEEKCAGAACGGGDKCCNDASLGPVCFSPHTHSCKLGRLGRVLCGMNDGVCGTACIDSSMYYCGDDNLPHPKN